MATKKNTVDSKVIKKTSKEKVVAEKKPTIKKAPAEKKVVAEKKPTIKKAPAEKKVVAEKKPTIKKAPAEKKVVAEKKTTIKKAPAEKKVVAEKKPTIKKAPAEKKVVAEKKPTIKKAPAEKKVVAEKKTTIKKAPAEKKVVAEKKPTIKKKSVLETVKKINTVVEERVMDLVDTVRELPSNYKETKLTLIMRDPDWCYFYWDISDEDINQHNIHSRELKVKIFQISGVDITLHKEHTEVSVGHIFGDYYINLQTPHAYFIGELGYYENGVFTVLVRSNVVYAPRDSISNIYDDKWAVNEEIVKILSEPSTLRVSLSSATIFELVDLSGFSGSSFSFFNKKDN